MSRFGKDYRLIGEATITGLRYEAGEGFWSALAHTDIIGRVKMLIEHYAVVGELAHKSLVYDRNELIAWLEARSGNCLKCRPYFKPGEAGRSATNDYARFNTEFFVKMRNIGLGWREFHLYYKFWVDSAFLIIPDEDIDGWSEVNIFGSNQPLTRSMFDVCLEPEKFVDVLNVIGENRRRIADLPTAKFE